MVALSLCGYVRAFSGCWKWGLLLIAMHGLFIAETSLVEHYLSVHGLSSHGMQALDTGSVVVAHGFSCFHGMWNLPGPGIKPTSPALAGWFLFTVPLWKSSKLKTFALLKTLLGKRKMILLEWEVNYTLGNYIYKLRVWTKTCIQNIWSSLQSQ